MYKQQIRWTAGICAVLALLAGPALATPLYDFETVGTGSINGKDGWTSNGLNGYTTTPDGNTSAGSGVCVTTYGGTGVSYGLRTNDAGWGYDLSGVSTFEMGAAIVIDYQVSGYYGNCEMLIQNSVTGKSIGFGFEVLPWFYSAYVMDATGTENNVANMGGAKGQKWDIELRVDLTANAGEGSATWWGDKLQTGTFSQFGSAVNLQLVTASANIGAANQVRLEVKTRLGALDDLYVTPEPATMGLLALGGIGLLFRRRRRH